MKLPNRDGKEVENANKGGKHNEWNKRNGTEEKERQKRTEV